MTDITAPSANPTAEPASAPEPQKAEPSVSDQLKQITDQLNQQGQQIVQVATKQHLADQAPRQAAHPAAPTETELTPPEYPVAGEDETVQEYSARMRQYHTDLADHNVAVKQREERQREQKDAQDAYNKQYTRVTDFFAKTPQAKDHIEDLRTHVFEKGMDIEDAWDLVRLRNAEATAKTQAEESQRRSSIRPSDSQPMVDMTRTYDSNNDAISAAIEAVEKESGLRFEELPDQV